MGGLKNDGLKWVNKEGGFRKMNGTTLGSVPKARPVPANGSNRRSGSDMDLDSGSDDEMYSGRYSVESSPQDDKVRGGVEQKHFVCAQRDSYYPTNGGRIGATKKGADIVRNIHCDATSMLSSRGHSHSSVKSSGGMEDKKSSNPFQPRLPNFHASGLSPWSSVVSYDACIRLCLTSSAKGCKDASFFLDNECVVLRDAFNLRHALLQSEEEVMSKGSSELISGSAAPKPKKIMGKIKVQVRKVKMGLDPQSGCSFPQMPKLEIERFQYRIKSVKSRLSSGWEAVQRVHAAHHLPKEGSLSQKSLAYMHVGTRYMKDIAGLLKSGLSSPQLTSSVSEVVQEAYSCLIRLKSSSDEDAVRMQPGSGETHIFFPDSLGDDLIIVISDSKGNQCGCVAAQVALVMDAANDKVRWWPVYKEPDHEPIGKIQLYINYLSQDDNSQLKYGIVAETVAYDLVLETAMKAQHFQQRNLLLHGHWRWLVNGFASFYGVSDAYTKLRYLSYVMDVATPTADCLLLIHDLLSPVIMKGTTLSHQEKRILGELSDQIEEILALVFENYKSLDETALSGLADEFKPTGVVAPALAPAIKLYALQHNIQSPEARLKLCKHFQVAAKTRSRRHLEEMDDSIFNNEGPTIDVVISTTAYEKMKSICLSVKNEIYTDIVINNQNVLPSFLDFPNLTSSIYSVELSLRLRTFLKACPPTGPSSPVTDLVITVADFERDLALWYINSIKGGVDAKEIFGSYISNWIKVKHAALIESCKLSVVKGSACKTEQLTSPFIDELYDQLRQTLNEYEVIVHRWPEYASVLENVMADVQNAVVEALEKQYADVLSPLKDNLARLGLKYVQKLAKRAESYYSVPSELGIVLNSLRRMLDVLFPKIETQLKTWSTCVVDSGNTAPGERLTEVTIMLRTKFRNLTQAVTEKLLENTRLQSATKWKKIIQDFKDISEESDVQSRMQQLQDMVVKTIDHLHSILETSVFVTVCRGFWDRMGQEVLHCLENGKENRSLYKGLRIALRILDATFATEIKRLLGNNVQHKDIEPPRTIVEAHAMLCKDSTSTNDGACYY